MAQPYASDYTNAIAGNFTFQIVMQDLNATTSAMVYAALKSPYVLGTLNLAYFGKCVLHSFNAAGMSDDVYATDVLISNTRYCVTVCF